MLLLNIFMIRQILSQSCQLIRYVRVHSVLDTSWNRSIQLQRSQHGCLGCMFINGLKEISGKHASKHLLAHLLHWNTVGHIKPANEVLALRQNSPVAIDMEVSARDGPDASIDENGVNEMVTDLLLHLLSFVEVIQHLADALIGAMLKHHVYWDMDSGL